ncbi:MAG: PatB family C-S lyase [Bacteroidales bacterium]|nr:PatB family C-S lyase [Bacteroidales bacterium]MCF8377031.1 PatB family C-S lyase [Bacteroidales bacterium]MCF8400890.1 PatB family C-S lyase [Bacteroidales bacterium]
MKYDFNQIVRREGTNSVKYDMREKVFGQGNVIPLWVADMDFSTPDFIRKAVIKRAKHHVYGYSFRGEGWYSSIIKWFKEQHNWEIEKDQIVFSPGIVPAINLCVQAFTKEGEGVIVQPPVYYPFFSAVEHNNRKLVLNPLKLENGRLCFDFDDLERKIKTQQPKMLLLCSPHNPGGSVWTREELQSLADICIQNKVLIISDEIHCDLVLYGNKHIPMATLSKAVANHTVACVAPSKTFNLAGMATSSVIIPNEELRERFEESIERVHVGMGNVFGNVASEAAYKHGAAWLKQLLKYIESNIDHTIAFLEHNTPVIKAIRPEATYMVWLDCRKLDMPDDELWKFMIHEAGVGLNRGDMFGKGGEGFLRMNVACPRITLDVALSNIRKAIRKET